jgi:hypothetical protein
VLDRYRPWAYISSPYIGPKTILLAEYEDALTRRFPASRDAFSLDTSSSATICDVCHFLHCNSRSELTISSQGPLSKANYVTCLTGISHEKTSSLPSLDGLDHVCTGLGSHVSIHRGPHGERRYDDAMEDEWGLLELCCCAPPSSVVECHVH